MPNPGIVGAAALLAAALVAAPANAFNPQPEPPAAVHVDLAASAKLLLPAVQKMFNPQPDPPGLPAGAHVAASGQLSLSAEAKMFNPQPDPPRTR